MKGFQSVQKHAEIYVKKLFNNAINFSERFRECILISYNPYTVVLFLCTEMHSKCEKYRRNCP